MRPVPRHVIPRPPWFQTRARKTFSIGRLRGPQRPSLSSTSADSTWSASPYSASAAAGSSARRSRSYFGLPPASRCSAWSRSASLGELESLRDPAAALGHRPLGGVGLLVGAPTADLPGLGRRRGGLALDHVLVGLLPGLVSGVVHRSFRSLGPRTRCPSRLGLAARRRSRARRRRRRGSRRGRPPGRCRSARAAAGPRRRGQQTANLRAPSERWRSASTRRLRPVESMKLQPLRLTITAPSPSSAGVSSARRRGTVAWSSSPATLTTRRLPSTSLSTENGRLMRLLRTGHLLRASAADVSGARQPVDSGSDALPTRPSGALPSDAQKRRAIDAGIGRPARFYACRVGGRADRAGDDRPRRLLPRLRVGGDRRRLRRAGVHHRAAGRRPGHRVRRRARARARGAERHLEHGHPREPRLLGAAGDRRRLCGDRDHRRLASRARPRPRRPARAPRRRRRRRRRLAAARRDAQPGRRRRRADDRRSLHDRRRPRGAGDEDRGAGERLGGRSPRSSAGFAPAGRRFRSGSSTTTGRGGSCRAGCRG